MTDYAIPIETMGTGTHHAAFTVTGVHSLPEFSGTAYVMRHTSGARALWVATPDTNKTFAIAFKTPPADDTGVFHILEHSVLCGSDHFPVKEPFVNLLKTSMQTFLNALTFADKTMYPVASTNTRDLENLMDVYLDAVLHPAIYARPRIFEQEGWHLEVAEDGSLSFNGVVYNEMKGATSDPDDVLFLALDRALFPDTPYSFESGGDPAAIPTLTYEHFLDNHARHYALENAYVILFGDMDIERELAFIDERLQGAAQRDAGAPNPLPLQADVVCDYMRQEMATAPENASVAAAYVIGTAADRERVLATDILTDALCGSNESPLKRRILDAGLADDFVATMLDGELQPRVVFQLKGAREGVAEKFQALLLNACRELVEEGIGHDQLAAALAQAEFNLREQDTGAYPVGVAVAMYAMAGWLYDDEHPIDYLRFEDEIGHMKAGLDEGYFENLLKDLVLESTHHALVELVPVEEGAAAAEAAALERIAAGMDEEALDAVRREVAALREEQEAPDSPEDLATLPQLRTSDIDAAAAEPALVRCEAPLPCIAHELDTRHIDYVYHYFDLRHLAYDDLPYVSVLCELLGKLPTARHTAAELDTLVQLNLGALDFFCETQGKDTDLNFAFPMLVVGASALSENVEQAARIPREVWGETDFTDTDRILAILTQRRVMLEQHFQTSGHAAAISRLGTYWHAATKVAGAMAGVDFYLFLKDLLANWDERADDLVSRLQDLAGRVFTASNVVVSFTGSAEERERYWAEAGGLGLVARPDLEDAHLEVPAPVPVNEAFVIPSNVSYVASGMAPSALDETHLGTWNVEQRVLSFDYLWNEVRVKGGAYGTGFRRMQSGIPQFWSYRDPSIDATLARFDATADWLASWDPTDEEMDGYVVSTVAHHDAPVKPRQLARRQDTLYFSERPDDWRDQVRAAELATTPESIRATSAALAELKRRRCVCVFAPREAIESSEVPFDAVIDLMG